MLGHLFEPSQKVLGALAESEFGRFMGPKQNSNARTNKNTQNNTQTNTQTHAGGAGSPSWI